MISGELINPFAKFSPQDSWYLPLKEDVSQEAIEQADFMGQFKTFINTPLTSPPSYHTNANAGCCVRCRKEE